MRELEMENAVKSCYFRNCDLFGLDFYHKDMDYDYAKTLVNRAINHNLQMHDTMFIGFMAGMTEKNIRPKQTKAFDEFHRLVLEQGWSETEFRNLIDDAVIDYNRKGSPMFWKKFFEGKEITAYQMCTLLGIDTSLIARVLTGRTRISKPLCFAVIMFFEMDTSQAKHMLEANGMTLCDMDYIDNIFVKMINCKQYEFNVFCEIAAKFSELVEETLGILNEYFFAADIFYCHYDEYTDATYSKCFFDGKFNYKQAKEAISFREY